MSLSGSLLQQFAPASAQDFENEAIATRQKQAANAQQIQGGDQELAARRRALAVSTLNGLQNEPDVQKQAVLYARLKPMAQQIDPSLELPDQYDPEMHKALFYSQIAPKDQLSLQVAAQKAEKPHAPSGYQFKPDGTLSAIPGGPGDQDTKPINEFQGKSGVFAARMGDADKLIAQFGTAGTDPEQRVRGSIPLIGNYLVSEDYQQLDQAKRNFVNAVLRQESGAAINQSEFDNAEKQYFPQPGDSEATIQQKTQNRKTAMAQMTKMAGRAYTPMPDAPPATERPSPTAAPQKGAIMDGYVFMGGDPADQKSWKSVR